ncbi:unnamed protein product [Orchesella dallaii]|uniref:Uncharacterized protein n=1 Tax=Orchesella dallaii TaxID=48710 RepID=A0ABP1RZT0_9HEXA
MQRYKIIPINEWNAFHKQKAELKEESELNSKLSKLPKSSQTKIRKLIEALQENGLEIQSNGDVIPPPSPFKHLNVFPHVAYIGRNKEKPDHFDSFLQVISNFKFQKGLLSAKIARDVKKAKKASNH